MMPLLPNIAIYERGGNDEGNYRGTQICERRVIWIIRIMVKNSSFTYWIRKLMIGVSWWISPWCGALLNGTRHVRKLP